MYLFFDTETTGLPRNQRAPLSDFANWPRMVQIAWLAVNETGKECTSGEFIIRPDGYKIPPDAARVHGITTERAESEGVPLAGVLVAFSQAVSVSSMVVAHNFSFDSKIVGAELLRAKMINGLQKRRHYCTMEASTNFCRLPGPYGYKWPRLDELYRALFEKKLDGAHRAMADVRACAECFFELRRRGIIR